jgi:hypothetical protein
MPRLVKPGPIDTIVALPDCPPGPPPMAPASGTEPSGVHCCRSLTGVIDCTMPQLPQAASDGLICADAGSADAAATASNARRSARTIIREAS